VSCSERRARQAGHNPGMVSYRLAQDGCNPAEDAGRTLPRSVCAFASVPPGSPNARSPKPGCLPCLGQIAAAGRECAGGTAGGGEWATGWAAGGVWADSRTGWTHAGGGKGRLICLSPGLGDGPGAWRLEGCTQWPKCVSKAVRYSRNPSVRQRGTQPGASTCTTWWTTRCAIARVRSPTSIASSSLLSGSIAVHTQ
jgi:hypothetical protein